MNGNAETYNADHALKLAKQPRNIQVAMAVFELPEKPQ